MLYTEKDYQNSKSALRRHFVTAAVIALIGISGMIVGIVMQIRWITDLCAAVFACLTYAYLSVKCMPHYRYHKFLRDMRAGRSRETQGWFVSLSDGTRMADGIAVHEVVVRIGEAEEDERLFFWDDDKPLPSVQPGDRLHIRSYGNYIIELTVT